MAATKMLLFLLVSSLSVNWVFAGSDYTDKDMAEVADWLKQQAENGDGTSKNFLELPSVLSSKKCDDSGAETLNANDRLVKVLASNQSVDKSMVHKIEAIVKSYQEKFTDMCYSSYSSLVNEKMNEISQESKKYVMQLARPGMVGIGALRQFVAQDPKRDTLAGLHRYEFQRQRVTHNDYIHYMVGPCEELNNEVTKDYFDVIELIVLIRGRNPMQAREKDFKGLSQNLAAMKACRNIIENKDQNWQRMEEFMAKHEIDDKARVKEHEEFLAEEARKNPTLLRPRETYGFFSPNSHLSAKERENIEKYPFRSSLLAFLKAFNHESHG